MDYINISITFVPEFERGVAQSGSASALGAEGRRFESCHPDNSKSHFKNEMTRFVIFNLHTP